MTRMLQQEGILSVLKKKISSENGLKVYDVMLVLLKINEVCSINNHILSCVLVLYMQNNNNNNNN